MRIHDDRREWMGSAVCRLILDAFSSGTVVTINRLDGLAVTRDQRNKSVISVWSVCSDRRDVECLQISAPDSRVCVQLASLQKDERKSDHNFHQSKIHHLSQLTYLDL